MALFSYNAIAPDGTPENGSMEANSEAQVIENLNKQGLIPVQVVAGGKSGAEAGEFSKKAPQKKPVW